MDKASICANIPDAYRAHATELVDQLEFMRNRLEDTRKNLDGAPLVMAYNNGGGQKGVRKNPGFDAYNSLMKTYIQALNELRDILGKQASAAPVMLKFEKYAKTMKKVAE